MATGANGLAGTLIEVRGAVRHYGDVRAVDGVDLAVEAGEIFGLIGHNGAGKSTLFKMMLGLVPLSAGEIRIDGEAVGGAKFREVRRRIGYLPENVVFYDNLTGLETLRFFADLKRVSPAGLGGLLETVGLGEAADRRVKGYSKGMRQRLGFAQALLGDPKLLFLDEPTGGLDPEAIRDFYAILRRLREQAVTMILTSHILADIQERVDRLAILKRGKVQALGTVAELREAMPLPLRLELRLSDERHRSLVGQALAGFASDEPQGTGTLLRIRCDRRHKMALLEAIAGLDGAVADIDWREPSLEDVFMGYAE